MPVDTTNACAPPQVSPALDVPPLPVDLQGYDRIAGDQISFLMGLGLYMKRIGLPFLVSLLGPLRSALPRPWSPSKAQCAILLRRSLGDRMTMRK